MMDLSHSKQDLSWTLSIPPFHWIHFLEIWNGNNLEIPTALQEL